MKKIPTSVVELEINISDKENPDEDYSSSGFSDGPLESNLHYDVGLTV